MESKIFRPVFLASGPLPAKGEFLIIERPRNISSLV